MTETSNLMEVRNVSKAFGEDWERERVVENLSLDIKRNQLTAIVGPSGCGKSTVVNLLAGFESPDSGQIMLEGVAVEALAGDRHFGLSENFECIDGIFKLPFRAGLI